MRKSKNKIEKKSVGRSAGFVVSPTFFAAALFEKFLFFSIKLWAWAAKVCILSVHSWWKSSKMSHLDFQWSDVQ